MAKLEELTELLCSELHDFEQGILRLEKLHQEMQGLKVKADGSEIQRLLHEYKGETRKDLERQWGTMDGILKKLGNAVLFPSWVVKLGWGLSVCTLLVLGYAVMEVSGAAKRESAAFIRGQERANEHFGEFLEEHPSAAERYGEWSEENKEE